MSVRQFGKDDKRAVGYMSLNFTEMSGLGGYIKFKSHEDVNESGYHVNEWDHRGDYVREIIRKQRTTAEDLRI